MDSSIHERYSTLFPLSDSVILHKQIRAIDGGAIIIGQLKTAMAYGYGVVMRLNKDESIRWSKRIVSNPFSGFVALETVEEASNGNIHIIARQNNGASDGRPPFYLLVLSTDGQVINQKRIGFINSPNLNNKAIRASLILKKGNDSLLYVLSGQTNAFTENQIFLVSADNFGVVGSSIIISTQPSGGWDSPVFRAGKLNGRFLTLYGSSGFIGQCGNGASNGLSFFSIKIDLSSKAVVFKKAFCAPPNSSFTGLYQAPRDFFSTAAYDNTYFLSNGNIVMTKAYNGIIPNLSGTLNQLFSISTFDSTFNHLHSEYVVTGDIMKSETIQELFIDSIGMRHFNFYDYNSQNIYYALADSTNKLFLQKKIFFSSSKPYSDFTRNTIADNKYLVNFTTIIYDNNSTYIDKFKILAKDTAQSCFGEDTAFLSFIPAQVSSINWQSQFSTENGILEEQAINFFSVDYPLQRTIICNIVHKCDSIKLNAPNIVCDISQPVIVTAHKNPLCTGKVNFSFDTTLAQSYSQINDTTLSLRFNRSCIIKIFGRPSSCDNIEDSVEIIVNTPLDPINLGDDTIYCPGKTYLLNAYNPGFKTYQWQDGSTDSVFLASSPGLYLIRATDNCNREYFDTIRIIKKDFQINLGRDSTLCKGGSMTLSVPSGYLSYNWLPSYNVEHIAPNSVVINPETTTTYNVQVEIFDGCKLSDTINVGVENCQEFIYFPSGFTPNNDGLNDSFKPLTGGVLAKYELQIYNRWGQIVFRTTNKTIGWDGKFNGTLQGNETFIYMCRFQFYDKPEKIIKGTLLVIR